MSTSFPEAAGVLQASPIACFASTTTVSADTVAGLGRQVSFHSLRHPPLDEEGKEG